MPPHDSKLDSDNDRTRTVASAPERVINSLLETREHAPSPGQRVEVSTDRGEATPTPLQITLPTKYTFKGWLGRGGMGEVLHAYDSELKRHVAIKFMRSKAAASVFARRRFLNEAQILAQMHHPNVVDVFEKGEIDGQPYFVMAYLDGYSLAERREEFRTSAARAVGVLVAVAAGVQHAHENGVCHRDLKASNVMFDAGRPVVVDFGCARWDEAEVSTQGFALLGTPSHMAPEVFELGSKEHDERADLWSLGVMLYLLLSGELPFGSDQRSPEGRARLLNDDPGPIRSHPTAVPGVDDRLEEIVRKALAKKPAERQQTAAEFAAELAAWLDSPPPPVVVAPAPKPKRRWRWAAAGLASILVVGVAAAAFWPKGEPSIAEVVGSGQPVVLVDGEGKLQRPLDTVPGFEGGIETVPAEKVLRVTSGSTLLANFRTDGLARPYLIRADVHHSFENLASEVGVVAAQRQHETNEFAVYTNTFRGSPNPTGQQRPRPAMAYGGPRWIAISDPRNPLKDFGEEPTELAVAAHPPKEPEVPLEFRRLVVVVTETDVTVEHDGRMVTNRRWRDIENATRQKFQGEQRPIPQPLFGDGIGLIVRNGTALFRNVVIEPAPPK